jgi:hypothetical protein
MFMQDQLQGFSFIACRGGGGGGGGLLVGFPFVLRGGGGLCHLSFADITKCQYKKVRKYLSLMIWLFFFNLLHQSSGER